MIENIYVFLYVVVFMLASFILTCNGVYDFLNDDFLRAVLELFCGGINATLFINGIIRSL